MGRSAGSGLWTAPLYDSAMFIARLSMLPGLVTFLLAVDTSVHQRTRDFMVTVEEHGTLRRIGERLEDLASTAHATLTRLIVLQAVTCAILVIVAPAIIGPVNLQYQQVGVLRFGLLGALFHTIFIAASTLVLHFGRGGAYLVLQSVFLAANACATAASLALSEQLLGLGYLLGTAASAVAALWVLQRMLSRLDYLTFHGALALRDDTINFNQGGTSAARPLFRWGKQT